MTKGACKANGCTRNADGGFGYCQTHYYRFKKHGSPDVIYPRSKEAKPCKRCGELFYPASNGRQVYCSQNCQVANYHDINKEEVKLKNADYREKNGEEVRSKKNLYRTENREKVRETERLWRENNKDRIKKYREKGTDAFERDREHRRKHYLKTSDGKIHRNLNKRSYPGECEICGKEQAMSLKYHHWDDNNLSMGLWLCWPCHKFAHLLDEWTLASKYLQLKTFLEIKKIWKDGELYVERPAGITK